MIHTTHTYAIILLFPRTNLCETTTDCKFSDITISDTISFVGSRFDKWSIRLNNEWLMSIRDFNSQWNTNIQWHSQQTRLMSVNMYSVSQICSRLFDTRGVERCSMSSL